MERLIPGSVWGGVLLIAGSCIGAGMLALPIVSGLCGFFPSVGMFLLTWLFMTFTGLLMVEINGWFYGRVNIISMAERSLGKVGKIISWTLYLFLFYSLLVAYISGSGSVLSSISKRAFSLDIIPSFAALCFAGVLGIVIYMGTKPVDFVNRIFMAALILFYFLMIFWGIFQIRGSFLFHVDAKYALIPFSILITSFGFHNMIPSLTAYMKGDLKRMRLTIIGGSLLALFIYLLWQILVLGVVPFGGKMGLFESYKQGREAGQVLTNFLNSTWAGRFAQSFSFFAIATSFLAQGLGLMHFIADGLKVLPSKDKRWWLCMLALVPPTFFALLYPQIFFQALSFAGGFCAIILFGVLPPVMAWIGRYREKITSSYHVKGGRVSLIIALSFSLFVIFNQLISFFDG